jgi:hypothetical protein
MLCLFLSFAYLLVAEAASFDKKELCRSDTQSLLHKGTQMPRNLPNGLL